MLRRIRFKMYRYLGMSSASARALGVLSSSCCWRLTRDTYGTMGRLASRGLRYPDITLRPKRLKLEVAAFQDTKSEGQLLALISLCGSHYLSLIHLFIGYQLIPFLIHKPSILRSSIVYFSSLLHPFVSRHFLIVNSFWPSLVPIRIPLARAFRLVYLRYLSAQQTRFRFNFSLPVAFSYTPGHSLGTVFPEHIWASFAIPTEEMDAIYGIAPIETSNLSVKVPQRDGAVTPAEKRLSRPFEAINIPHKKITKICCIGAGYVGMKARTNTSVNRISNQS
jgi:hypothetical protein